MRVGRRVYDDPRFAYRQSDYVATSRRCALSCASGIFTKSFPIPAGRSQRHGDELFFSTLRKSLDLPDISAICTKLAFSFSSRDAFSDSVVIPDVFDMLEYCARDDEDGLDDNWVTMFLVWLLAVASVLDVETNRDAGAGGDEEPALTMRTLDCCLGAAIADDIGRKRRLRLVKQGTRENMKRS